MIQKMAEFQSEQRQENFVLKNRIAQLEEYIQLKATFSNQKEAATKDGMRNEVWREVSSRL